MPLRAGLVSIYIKGFTGYKYNTCMLQTLYNITFIKADPGGYGGGSTGRFGLHPGCVHGLLVAIG
jgi:hypothetical protein